MAVSRKLKASGINSEAFAVMGKCTLLMTMKYLSVSGLMLVLGFSFSFSFSFSCIEAHGADTAMAGINATETNIVDSKSTKKNKPFPPKYSGDIQGHSRLFKSKVLWLNAELKARILKQFSYRINKLRVRYWRNDYASAWLLEEVGKEQPITFGVVIEDEKIHSIEVLRYRESRGGEIQHAFFQKQFLGAQLNQSKKTPRLSQSIDGITGATLSVNAMKKIAKVALYLDRESKDAVE
ncbi:MAG: hypothetical protein ACI93R_000775 [Flavobacteriales bacterium]|jgi:hypothetical protein